MGRLTVSDGDGIAVAGDRLAGKIGRFLFPLDRLTQNRDNFTVIIILTEKIQYAAVAVTDVLAFREGPSIWHNEGEFHLVIA